MRCCCRSLIWSLLDFTHFICSVIHWHYSIYINIFMHIRKGSYFLDLWTYLRECGIVRDSYRLHVFSPWSTRTDTDSELQTNNINESINISTFEVFALRTNRKYDADVWKKIQHCCARYIYLNIYTIHSFWSISSSWKEISSVISIVDWLSEHRWVKMMMDFHSSTLHLLMQMILQPFLLDLLLVDIWYSNYRICRSLFRFRKGIRIRTYQV